MTQIALVSRDVYPLGPGGIAVHVRELAEILQKEAEVTIFTTSRYEERYEELKSAADPRLVDGVEVVFVPEMELHDTGTYFSFLHRWSARVHEAIVERFGQGGPSLVEFPDYHGEGAVAVQAARSFTGGGARGRVVVRMHTSAEQCAILDGYLPSDTPTRIDYDLERYALRHADAVIWPGGDVLGAYQRLYGRDGLAPACHIPAAFLPPSASQRLEDGAPSKESGALRLLYMGRLERRKGVQNLMHAVISLERDDWQLTVLGSDTQTAPLGASMRSQLELMAAEDPRVVFRDAVPRTELTALIEQHDVVVLPSLWECGSYAALEAMSCNRPIVATPTGGLVEMVVPGESGWLTERATGPALTDLLEELLNDRARVTDAIERGAPRAVLSRLADPGRVMSAYLELANKPVRRRPAKRQPLVSVVVPYYRLEGYVAETLESLSAQTYQFTEIVIVNDGSLREDDRVLFELANRHRVKLLTQPNTGLGAARNAGIRQTRGDYVFPLDADNLAEPEFVERCVEVLEGDASLAYATSWSRYIDEHGNEHTGGGTGYQPLGNWCSTVDVMNVAGDAAALIRRRVFDLGFWYSQDLTSYEDWALYRELHQAGIFGHVIPERLLRYRIRARSMLREIGLPWDSRLIGEIEAHLASRRIQWESKSA